MGRFFYFVLLLGVFFFWSWTNVFAFSDESATLEIENVSTNPIHKIQNISYTATPNGGIIDAAYFENLDASYQLGTDLFKRYTDELSLEIETYKKLPPRFVPIDCVRRYQRAKCGFVSVPENRDKENTRSIKIPVSIIPASNEKEKLADPIVYFHGGPGANTIGHIFWLGQFQALIEKRDLIIVHQRGAHGDNKLCQKVQSLWIFDIGEAGSEQDNLNALTQLMNACYDKLRQSGRDPDGYTTEQNALDVRDVRLALGINTWNVWSVSYGTTLAQEYLHVDEAATRSLVMDGTVPLNLPWNSGTAERYKSLYEEIDDMCLVDEKCRNQYGSLTDLLSRAFDKVRIEPLVVSSFFHTYKASKEEEKSMTELKVSDHELSPYIHTMMRFPETFQILPFFLESVLSDSDFAKDQLRGFYGSYANDNGTFDIGSYYAIACRLDVMSSEEAAALRSRVPLFLINSGPFFNMHSICPNLDLKHSVPKPLITRQTPTLFISGKQDHITPQDVMYSVLPYFPNSRHIVFEQYAHGASVTEEGGKAVGAFFDNPEMEPEYLSIPFASYRFVSDLILNRYFAMSGAEIPWFSGKLILVLPIVIIFIFLVVRIINYSVLRETGGGLELLIAISVLLMIVQAGWAYFSIYTTEVHYPVVTLLTAGVVPIGSTLPLWITPALIFLSGVLIVLGVRRYGKYGFVEYNVVNFVLIAACILLVMAHIYIELYPYKFDEIWSFFDVLISNAGIFAL